MAASKDRVTGWIRKTLTDLLLESHLPEQRDNNRGLAMQLVNARVVHSYDTHLGYIDACLTADRTSQYDMFSIDVEVRLYDPDRVEEGHGVGHATQLVLPETRARRSKDDTADKVSKLVLIAQRRAGLDYFNMFGRNFDLKRAHLPPRGLASINGSYDLDENEAGKQRSREWTKKNSRYAKKCPTYGSRFS